MQRNEERWRKKKSKKIFSVQKAPRLQRCSACFSLWQLRLWFISLKFPLRHLCNSDWTIFCSKYGTQQVPWSKLQRQSTDSITNINQNQSDFPAWSDLEAKQVRRQHEIYETAKVCIIIFFMLAVIYGSTLNGDLTSHWFNETDLHVTHEHGQSIIFKPH